MSSRTLIDSLDTTDKGFALLDRWFTDDGHMWGSAAALAHRLAKELDVSVAKAKAIHQAWTADKKPDVSEKKFRFRAPDGEIHEIEAESPMLAIRKLVAKHGEKAYKIVSIDESFRRRTPNIRAMRALLPALRGENGPEALEIAIEDLKSLTEEPRILGLIDDLRGVNGPEKAHEAWGTLISQIGGTLAQHKTAAGKFKLGEDLDDDGEPSLPPPTGWESAKYFKGKVHPEIYDLLIEFETEHGMSRFKRYENHEIKDVWLANDFKGWVWLYRYDQDKWEPHYNEKRALEVAYRDDSFL